MTDESIFQIAIAIPVPDARAAYLSQVCSTDSEQRERVEALIASHENAGSFLEQPAAGINSESVEAGLTATFGPDAAVVVGDPNHSVLKMLSKRMPSTPNVTLRDATNDSAGVAIPGSVDIPNTESDSRYQLHGEIARGGMGAIIKGRDNDLGRDLAIKVLLDSHKGKPDVLQRFVEEAQIGGQLQHPGVAPVYELGQFGDERPFFTMKLVKGKTLAAILAIRDTEKEDRPRLLGIFEQICQTMAYVHTKGVLHRDLKPANVMVGAFGEVQVMDWGLSKVMARGGVADEKKSLRQQHDVSVIETRRSVGSDGIGSAGSQTQMGSVMGTPAYMPPEQALGEVDQLDERADVFALGAILAEILTGKPAYVGENGTEVYRLASRGSLGDCFARLDECGAEPELIDLAKQSLAPELKDRFADAGVLSQRITGYLEGVQERLKESERAKAEAELRAEENQKRKKLYLAIAGLMLLLAVGGLIGSTTYWQLAQSEAQQKDQAKLAAEEQRRLRLEQEFQTKRANTMRLAAVSPTFRKASKSQSLLAAVEAAESSNGLGAGVERFAQNTLLDALGYVGGQPLIQSKKTEEKACFSNDGKWLLAGSGLWRFDANTGPHSRIELQDEVVWEVAIDPNSRWAATGSPDGTVRLFALNENVDPPVGLRLDGHDATISRLSFSPDGRYLATAGGNKVQVWDLDESDLKNPVSVLEPGHGLATVEFQPVEGRYLVGSDVDQTTVWSNQDGVFEKLATLDGGVSAMHSNGKLLATVSSDKARIWDSSKGDFANPKSVFESQFSIYRKIGFVRNSNKLIISGGRDATVLWDLASPNARPRKLGANAGNFLQVSPNGHQMITTAPDRCVCVWDLRDDSLGPRSQTILFGHDDQVYGTAISPDNKWLVTCSIGGDPSRVWRLDRIGLARSPFVLAGAGYYRGTFFSQDGRYLVNKYHGINNSHLIPKRYSLSDERVPIAVWDLPDDQQRTCCSQSRDGLCLWMAVGREDGTVAVYDLSQPSPKIEYTFSATDNVAIDNIAISNDGRFVFTHSNDGELSLHEVGESGGKPTTTEIDANYGAKTISADAMSLFISSDNHWLASCRDSEGWLWKLDNNQQRVAEYRIPKDRMLPGVILFSPDSRWAATRAGTRVWLWDLTTNDPTASPIVLEGIGAGMNWSFAFSRDGSRLVVGSWNTTVSVWDLRANEIPQTRVSLTGANAAISGVAIGNEGLVAAGCKGGTVMVWDLNDDDPNAMPYRFSGAQGDIGDVDIHPGGKMIASTDFTTIRLWDLDRDKTIRMAKSLAGRELTELEQKQIAMPE